MTKNRLRLFITLIAVSVMLLSFALPATATMDGQVIKNATTNNYYYYGLGSTEPLKQDYRAFVLAGKPATSPDTDYAVWKHYLLNKGTSKPVAFHDSISGYLDYLTATNVYRARVMAAQTFNLKQYTEIDDTTSFAIPASSLPTTIPKVLKDASQLVDTSTNIPVIDNQAIRLTTASITEQGINKNVTVYTSGLVGSIDLSTGSTVDYLTAGSITANTSTTLQITAITGANQVDGLAILTLAGKSASQQLVAGIEQPLNLITYLSELDPQQNGVSMEYLRTLFGSSVKITGNLSNGSAVKLVIKL